MPRWGPVASYLGIWAWAEKWVAYTGPTPVKPSLVQVLARSDSNHSGCVFWASSGRRRLEDTDCASTSGIQYTIKSDRRVLMPEVVKVNKYG